MLQLFLFHGIYASFPGHVLLRSGLMKLPAMDLDTIQVAWLLDGSRDDSHGEYASYQASHGVHERQSVA